MKNLTLKQVKDFAQFIIDFTDKNIPCEVIEEKYLFDISFQNTEQAIESYLIFNDIIDRAEIWGEELYSVFQANISDDGWLTSAWGSIIEREIEKRDKYYQENPEYSETYSRMYMTDFIESSCGKYIRPVIEE